MQNESTVESELSRLERSPENPIDVALENFSLIDNRELDDFLKAVPHQTHFGAEEVVLFRRKMPSRYAYDSWANFNTGYGRVFHDEVIGRTRSNGAGVEDPDWVYIKVTFKF